MIMDHRLLAPGVALAVLALAMALPQGSALAKGMDVKTADLFPTDDSGLIDCNGNAPLECESEGFGTAAAVTDNRTRLFGGNQDPWTAWAVSWEGLHAYWYYGVYNDPSGEDPCGEHDSVYDVAMSVYDDAMRSDQDGSAFRNIEGNMNPGELDTVWICRSKDTPLNFFHHHDPPDDLIPIFSGVLEGGGRNNSSKKKNR